MAKMPMGYEDISNPSTGITNCLATKTGNIAIINFKGCSVSSGTAGTLPEGIRPKVETTVFGRMNVGSNYQATLIVIQTSGVISVSTFIPNTSTRDVSPTGTALFGEAVYETA